MERQPWLRDHALGDSVLFPGTAFLELALQACERLAPPRSPTSRWRHHSSCPSPEPSRSRSPSPPPTAPEPAP
ncbi:hypothetical protein ACFQ51_50790 [Streptomyces kaempferi]